MQILFFFTMGLLIACSPVSNPERSKDKNIETQPAQAQESLFLTKVHLLDGTQFLSPVTCVNGNCDRLADVVMSKKGIATESIELKKYTVLKGKTKRSKSSDSSASQLTVPVPHLSPRRASEPSIQKNVVSDISLGRRRSANDVQQTIHEQASGHIVRFASSEALFGLPTLSVNKDFSIHDIESALHAKMGASKSYTERLSRLTESYKVVTRSRESLEAESLKEEKSVDAPNFISKKTSLIEGMREELATVSGQLDTNLKKLGESVAFVLAHKTAKSAQLSLIINAKRSDGSFKYSDELRNEAATSLKDTKGNLTPSDELNQAFVDNRVMLMMRKVSDQGFMAFAMGRPTKRLELKAKSDNLGNIPINQVFTHKVKGEGDVLIRNRAMFNEFSFQSRASLLDDGLPNSFNKQEVRMLEYLDGEMDEQVGVKSLYAAPDAPVSWINKADFEALPLAERETLAVYEVHADPRSMKGSSEAMIKLWKKWRVDSEDLPPSQGSFTHLKNTDWEVEGGVQKSQSILITEDDLRQKHLANAEIRNLDYAEFLVRAEAVGFERLPELTKEHLYSRKVTDQLGGEDTIKILAKDRLGSAGAIAPDIDLLSVGINKKAANDDTFDVMDGIGRTNPLTKSLLEQTTQQSEGLLLQKAIHHGSEDLNFEFPQNLKDDYPIGVVSTDGVVRKISISDGQFPHEFLFKFLREHPDMTTSINPAYVVNNAKEFPKDKARWPPAQIQKMKVYEKWIDDGIQNGGIKKPYFEELKVKYNDFKTDYSFVGE